MQNMNGTPPCTFVRRRLVPASWLLNRLSAVCRPDGADRMVLWRVRPTSEQEQ